MKRHGFAVIFFFALQLHAQGMNVSYLGLSDGSIPEMREQFDNALRDRLSMLSSVSLVDYRRTRLLREKAGFSHYPRVSRELVQELMKVTQDSTLVVWAEVENHNITARRKNLIRAQAVGRLKLRLVMYSLNYRDYVYTGIIEAQCRLGKGLALFRPVKTVTHITVEDRRSINDSLISDVVSKSERAVAGVVRSWLERGGALEQPTPGVQSRQEPSIEDLFGIPSVDGENLTAEDDENPDQMPRDDRRNSAESEQPPLLPLQ